MTVQELIEQLQDFPKDMPVRICGDTFDCAFEQDVDYTDIDKKKIRSYIWKIKVTW